MEKTKEREFHGLRKTSEYNTWCGMRQRCNNSNSPGYRNYGGRGITVCDRWNMSFVNFLDDMGAKPSAEHSIDRIDNNLGYFPDNCRWADKTTQANNQRGNKLITIGGVTKTLAQWSLESGIQSQIIHGRIERLGWSEQSLLKEVGKQVFEYRKKRGTLTKLSKFFGFDYDMVRQRITKLGWSLEKAIETPAKFRKDGGSLKSYSACGKSLTLRQWAEETGIKYETILARIRAGKSIEIAVTDPLNTRHDRK